MITWTLKTRLHCPTGFIRILNHMQIPCIKINATELFLWVERKMYYIHIHTQYNHIHSCHFSLVKCIPMTANKRSKNFIGPYILTLTTLWPKRNITFQNIWQSHILKITLYFFNIAFFPFTILFKNMSCFFSSFFKKISLWQLNNILK